MKTLSLRQKQIYSVLLTASIAAAGYFYQHDYHARKIRYTEVITGYYRKYFHREPDAIGLRHWVSWALNKWSLEKVEQKGFIEAAEKENAAAH